VDVPLKETDMENDQDKLLGEVTSGEYKYGFVTDIDTEVIPKGLN